MRSTIGFILSLVVKLFVFVLIVYFIMSALGIRLEDIKKLLPEGIPASAAYADELLDETVCVFYDGDELLSVIAVPSGMAFTPPVPEKEGYIFLGWKTGGDRLTDEIIPRGRAMLLYADYSPIEYTVSYYNLDGSLIGSYTVTVESDLSSVRPLELEGREFLCWINALEPSEEITPSYTVGGDLILLPKYTAARTPFSLSVWLARLWNLEAPVLVKLLIPVFLCLALYFAVKYLLVGADRLVKAVYRMHLKRCFLRYEKLIASGKRPSEALCRRAALFSVYCPEEYSDAYASDR